MDLTGHYCMIGSDNSYRGHRGYVTGSAGDVEPEFFWIRLAQGTIGVHESVLIILPLWT